MVFIGRLKTDIKRKLYKFVGLLAIIFAITAFIVNAVFADTGLSIPVEIIWDDGDASARPAQVILTLRESGNPNVIQTATLTSADQSPNNPNKWLYTFTDVSYTSNSVFEITQSSFDGYQVDGPVQSTVSATPGSGILHRVATIPPSDGGFHDLDQPYDNVFFHVKNKYYLWTYDDYSSNYTSVAASIIEQLDLDISPSEVQYFYGHNKQNPDNPKFILFRHYVNAQNFGTKTQVRISSNRQVDWMYGGDVAAHTGTLATFTNTKVTNHSVSYQFTGTTQPPNASQLLPASAQYAPGTTVTVAQNPTASGYRFLGWKINGSDAGTSFTMPSSDVTITGSWERFNGYFAPTISKQVTSSQDVYRFGDTVEFLITVSNTESYPITNVEVTEGLSGARFIAASGYTVSNSGNVATIATIPANGTAVLYAEYDITDDVTQTGRTNTVEITAASPTNYYYLDTSQSITASASFDTQSWQDVPVLTGVDISPSTTLLYYFLLVLGAGGIVGGVVVNQKNKEREK